MARAIRLYTDEHVGRAVVHALRQRGVDVLTALQAAPAGTPDSEHLARASAEGRIIFTQDADFLRLHSQGVAHAGIVYAAQGAALGDIIRGLLLVSQVLGAEDMVNHVEFL